MHCRSCELLLEDAIGGVQGVTKVKVDFRKGCATVEHNADIPSQNEIENAVKTAGYSVGEPGKLPWITSDATDWRYIVFGIAIIVVLYYALRGTGLLTFSLDENNVNVGFALLLGLVAGVSTCMALVGGLILVLPPVMRSCIQKQHRGKSFVHIYSSMPGACSATQCSVDFSGLWVARYNSPAGFLHSSRSQSASS